MTRGFNGLKEKKTLGPVGHKLFSPLNRETTKTKKEPAASVTAQIDQTLFVPNM